VDGKDPGTATHWQLTGSYKAANGNYGEFQLNETGTTGLFDFSAGSSRLFGFAIRTQERRPSSVYWKQLHGE
jgi:hypothetical protein